MHRILVYHTGALGDFVALIPGLRLARRVRPHSRITLLGRMSHGALAQAYGLVDEVEDASGPRYRHLYGPEADAADVESLRGYDEALVFTATQTLVRALRGRIPGLHAQPPHPPSGIWVYDYMTRFVADALGVTEGDPSIYLACMRTPILPGAQADTPGAARAAPAIQTAPASASAPAAAPGVAWLHPGSGAAVKCWPPERFGALAGSLRAAGWSVRWSFGPADHKLQEHPGLGIAPEDVVSRMDTPLDLARKLGDATVYVGADTGPTHLAAAVGCPVVALFGPTDERAWRPTGGERTRVIARRSACAAPPGQACRMELPPRCPRVATGSAACLSAIAAVDVHDAVTELAAACGPWVASQRT